jgi:hypothetical protein
VSKRFFAFFRSLEGLPPSHACFSRRSMPRLASDGATISASSRAACIFDTGCSFNVALGIVTL